MSEKDFPIVGVGASAGGLDAYKSLLKSLPTDTGAAYILIQHLDPNHESMMAELLARQTSMKVLQAENEMALEPNTVYVIPPGKFIRLIDHGLFLDDPVKEKGIRMAIDYFFRSLAEVRGEKSIAIVLSGTGSDGTLGIREIKAAGGMVMVQKPDDAEYDGMPRSAIDTGAVDFIAPVREMGERLVDFLRHPYLRKHDRGTALSEEAPDGFAKVLKILRSQTDYDFRSYKKGTVERRIQRRMGLRQAKTLEDYVEIMGETPEEVQQLFRDLLIGVTRFFREPEAWEAFGDEVLDPLVTRTKNGARLRAWVPGCASGEEAYTLAMTLFDRIERQNKEITVQIFATDLNDRAIEAARSGHYSSAASPDIPEKMLNKYFTEDGDNIRVNKRLRETVVFATQNVISDPPFSKLDLITCRNLMIYLESDVQQRMIEMFHFALADGGHLFLGNSENAERPGRLFIPVDKTHRIYRKSDAARAPTGSFPIVPAGRRGKTKETDKTTPVYSASTEQARRTLMERFVPAAVMIDRSLEVQYFHGPVRHYLDFPSGEPTVQLPEMVVPALRTKLRALVTSIQSGKSREEAVVQKVPRNGHEVSVRLVAESLSDPETTPAILIYFEDVSELRDTEADREARERARASSTPEEQSEVASLEYELQSTREDLQSTIEEMETANEELKASNEEVMSMNEELQSTNEELETSREELQSLNEELATVNSQLEDKIEELERTNNDLTNLLVSTDIGVIFLDTELLIRRFTPAMKDIMRIIDSDVGRPVEDIAMRVSDPKLIKDARVSLQKLTEIEAEITNDEKQHLIRRVRPYRTSENRIEGVVVTYTDVTKLQNARAAARLREQQQEAVAELGREALAGEPLGEVLDSAVQEVAKHLGVRFAKILQLDGDRRNLTLRANIGFQQGELGVTKVEAGVRSQAGFTLDRSTPVVVRDFREEKRFSAPPLLKDHHILCGASVIIGPVDDPWGVLGAHEMDIERCGFDADDINFLQSVAHVLWLVIARDRSIAELDRERAQLRDMTDALPVLFAIVDRDARYEFVNKAYEAWGADTGEVEGSLVSDILDDDAFREVEPHIKAALNGAPQNFEVTVKPFGGKSSRASLVSYVPRRDENGDVTGFYSASIDISRQKRLERNLAERFEQYRVLGESIPFGVWITDAEGKLTYVSQSFLDLIGMTEDEASGFGWIDCLEEATREETARLWEETRDAGANWEKEHRVIGKDGQTYHVLALGRPIRNAAGEITTWVGLNLNITERKAEEERLSVISAELDHRVKNILATVSTIARMTGRSASSLDDYRNALQSRLYAMATAHKLLAEQDWRGMDLGLLVKTELEPYAETHADRVRIEGPEVRLPPSMVQSLALALHELTTNSAKYGALASDGGRLEISWQTNGRTTLSWNESGLENVSKPETQGFGTTLLTKILAAQDVDVHLDFAETGLSVDVTFG
ncbi:chemotaxis protein CheB [Sulfitobacter sp. D35]|uniref:chemotaxis protein CheB n=1 Tax=Sulfitobacter sp. D35 TaxID=3083252 RepID=UPI00296EE265|nr:chemotaxis protein CheB [Sulfitobacter sp. D35]MDW4499937.1 chemotaxis protein CheB [Sulfitobacter sp. D35]